MKFFADEQLSISKIFAIHRYSDTTQDVEDKPVVQYGTTSKYCQLIYFLYGDNTVSFDGIRLYDKEGSIRFLPAISTNDYYVERRGAGCCIDIMFSYDGEIYSEATAFYEMGALKTKFNKIYNLWQYKQPGYYLNCMSLLYDIIFDISTSDKAYTTNSQKSKLASAHNYIMSNYRSAEFDYKKLCQTTGYSYSYFKTAFKKCYGMSPIKYVTKLRMQYACELLITGIYSVTKIAELCGYDNVYYFSKVFKENTGVSPGKYT